MNEVEEFLEHFGKKGMRWGVRNIKRSSPKKTSSDHKEKVKIGKQRTPQLTNKQIQKYNTRANLESNYNKLNPARIKRGKFAAKSIMGSLAAGATLYNLANSPFGKAGIALAKKTLESAKFKRLLLKETGDQLKLF